MTTVTELLDEARKEFKAEENFKSISIAEQAVKKATDKQEQAHCYVTLFVIFDFLNDENKKISYLQKSKKLANHNIEELNIMIAQEFYKYCGHISFQENAYKKAKSYCQDNLNNNANLIETYLFFAKLFDRDEDTKIALSYLDKAIVLDVKKMSEAAEIALNRTRLFPEQYTSELTIKWAERHNTSLPEIMLTLGICYYELGDYEKAKPYFIKCLSNKYAKVAQAKLIESYEKEGKYKNAIEILKKKGSLSDYENLKLSKLHLLIQETSIAEDIISKLPQHLSQNISNMYQELGNYDQAIHFLNEKGPFRPSEHTYYNKAWLFFKKYWVQASDIKTFSNKMQPEFLSSMAICGRSQENNEGIRVKLLLLEVRRLFLLNISQLKKAFNKFDKIKKTNAIAEYEDFAFEHYGYRLSLKKTVAEINDIVINSPSFNNVNHNDFRALNHRHHSLRAYTLIENLYEKAQIKIDNYNYEKLQNSKKLTTKEAWALLNICFSQNKWGECLSVIEIILKDKPVSPNTMFTHGLVLLKKSEYTKAIKQIETGIRKAQQYHEPSGRGYNFLQMIYAELAQKEDSTRQEREIAIQKLNDCFSSWFNSDIMSYNSVLDSNPRMRIHRGNINNIQNVKLYKYKAFDINTISSLSSQSLYFSKPQQLNDPFDMKGFIQVMQEDEFQDLYPSTKSNISCFCTTLKRDNLQMWAHYAESHKGICIGYEFYELPQNIAWRAIDYEGKLAENSSLIDKLFSKTKNWEYEEEVRFIKFSETSQLTSIHPAAKNSAGIKGKISEIIIGSNFDKDKYGPTLEAILAQINSEYERLSLNTINVYQAQRKSNPKADVLNIIEIQDFR